MCERYTYYLKCNNKNNTHILFCIQIIIYSDY